MIFLFHLFHLFHLHLLLHMIKLIIIASIGAVSIITVPTAIAIANDNKEDTTKVTTTTPTIPDPSEPSIKCDVGYKLVDGECSIDYLIKPIYFSKVNENIRLISDEYSLNKIRKMIIDGKTVNPTKNYIFNENGTHIILYSFFPLNISTKNEAIGIFNGIENLLNVEFSSYNDDYPDVSFNKMFNNCINLISVNFSKFYENFYSLYDYSEYYYLMDYMFNNCINLKLVNFFNTIPPDGIEIFSTKFMFNNCISLTSIDLSYFYFEIIAIEDYKTSLNNMFSNCISLKVINYYLFLSPNYFHVNMSYMFYNCSSLTSVNLSRFFYILLILVICLLIVIN